MTVKVKDNHDFIGWILSWGDTIEVLEPQSLREEIKKILESSYRRYVSKNRQPTT
jgi:predicted DNA-binding transcriptional regulator YafY